MNDQPRIETRSIAGGTEVLFRGRFTLRDSYDVLRDSSPTLESGTGPLIFNLEGIAAIDSGAAALLLRTRSRLRAAGREVVLSRAPPAVDDVLDLLGDGEPRASLRDAPGSESTLSQIGRTVAEVGRGSVRSLGFVGAMASAVGAVLARPRSMPWRELPRLAERTGADGLPIVVTINFLVGTTLALQAAIQLGEYGLDVYVADSVALATTRSLGPLMTAIIVAGRSGAGFAAELGTMKVSEEIDALRTLGLDPRRYLVLPRVLALVFCLPLLTLAADLASILGGLLIGVVQLGLTPSEYIERTLSALSLAHVFSGVLKSVFFGLAIGFIACQRGLSTEGGAEGVGRATTSTVVSIIFALVILEALFTSLFDVWGI